MPYITHNHPAVRVSEVEFQPWNDVLCIGHTHGIETIIAPGAGYANFDSRECNIFETSKQRRNREVRMLLEKLPASTITLYPDLIGKVNKTPRAVEDLEENTQGENKTKKKKNKKRGRSKITNVLKNKQIAYASTVRSKASKVATQRREMKQNSQKAGFNSPTRTAKASKKTVTRNALERFKSF